MKAPFIVLISLLGVALCYAADAAADGFVNNPARIPADDPANDTKALAAGCAACHGAEGIANNPAWPNLAGQKRGYLAAQIKAFRDGRRNNPLMNAAVRQLSDHQINRLAGFYAAIKAPKTGIDVPKKSAAERFEAGRHVRAYCISCHGKQGISVNEEWPNLAGQQKEYLRQQLLDYQSGRRTGLPMSVIAGELNELQIESVAQYYSQLP